MVKIKENRCSLFAEGKWRNYFWIYSELIDLSIAPRLNGYIILWNIVIFMRDRVLMTVMIFSIKQFRNYHVFI